ncbi:putative phosphothreonine lyase domain-containg protein [Halovivax gelatinilyticus]|uniref:putative phosphothreonine lyase domain-containing protein n=1 Tax=Halovivax gelatinilyticus TaxID=2961597 RepID=UPI0020CA4E08|nr:putative phosphothreonine lyase domain-containg protein [Halovivax gelatinilyticus]
MQSPLEITEEEQYWLRSRDVSESPKIGGDDYFTDHGVTRPENVQSDDLPPAETEAVREIDRDALSEKKTIGKWQVTGSPARIDGLWPELVADAQAGIIWAVKAMTAFGYEELSMYDDYLLTVYTPNYFDRRDVTRVREHLRDAHDVTHELYYKPDIYTAKGIVAETAEEFGLSAPARYIQ